MAGILGGSNKCLVHNRSFGVGPSKAVSLRLRSWSKSPRHRFHVKSVSRQKKWRPMRSGRSKSCRRLLQLWEVRQSSSTLKELFPRCPRTSFSAPNSGACGFVQALLGACQEASAACAGGDRQSLRAESSVRSRSCRGRGMACQSRGRETNIQAFLVFFPLVSELQATRCIAFCRSSPDSRRSPSSLDSVLSSPFRRYSAHAHL